MWLGLPWQHHLRRLWPLLHLFHIQNGIWSSFSTVLEHWFVCPPMHEGKDLWGPESTISRTWAVGRSLLRYHWCGQALANLEVWNNEGRPRGLWDIVKLFSSCLGLIWPHPEWRQGPGKAVVRPTWLHMGKNFSPATQCWTRAMIALESDWQFRKNSKLHCSLAGWP